jgi:HNH endonuclease
MARTKGTTEERFWRKVEKTEACWLWTAHISPSGYGIFKYDGTPKNAHRYAYQLLVGPIPEGLEIDHLCRVRNCVNPEHLEAVTHLENVRRGVYVAMPILTRINAEKTHCKYGHPFSGNNLIVRKYGNNGKTRRECRTCTGIGFNIPSAKKTHCKSGHPFSGANLMIRKDGGRDCRTCHRISSHKYRQRRKERSNG